MRLSENQKLILKTLADLGELPTGEIIRSLYREVNNSARAAISRSLKNLEIKGLVKIRHKDLMEMQSTIGKDRVYVKVNAIGLKVTQNLKSVNINTCEKAAAR